MRFIHYILFTVLTLGMPILSLAGTASGGACPRGVAGQSERQSRIERGRKSADLWRDWLASEGRNALYVTEKPLLDRIQALTEKRITALEVHLESLKIARKDEIDLMEAEALIALGRTILANIPVISERTTATVVDRLVLLYAYMVSHRLTNVRTFTNNQLIGAAERLRSGKRISLQEWATMIELTTESVPVKEAMEGRRFYSWISTHGMPGFPVVNRLAVRGIGVNSTSGLHIMKADGRRLNNIDSVWHDYGHNQAIQRSWQHQFHFLFGGDFLISNPWGQTAIRKDFNLNDVLWFHGKGQHFVNSSLKDSKGARKEQYEFSTLDKIQFFRSESIYKGNYEKFLDQIQNFGDRVLDRIDSETNRSDREDLQFLFFLLTHELLIAPHPTTMREILNTPERSGSMEAENLVSNLMRFIETNELGRQDFLRLELHQQKQRLERAVERLETIVREEAP